MKSITDFLSTKKHIDLIIVLFLVLVTSIILFNGVGEQPMWLGDEQVHFQWAEHVMSSGDYLTPWAYGEPTLGIVKPPLIIWLMSFSLRVFEQNFAMRFWSALFGILCSVILYFLGKLLFNRFVGISSSIILLSFTSFYALSRIGLFDVPFLFFVLGSLYLFLLSNQKPEREKQYAILSGIFFGLALMTKQLTALLIPLIILVYLVLTTRKLHVFKNKSFWWILTIGSLIFSPWLILMTVQFGSDFFNTYFNYAVLQRATTAIEGKTGNYFFYFDYLLSSENIFLVFLLPISFGLTTFYALKSNKNHVLLFAWIVIILGVFTFSQTKLSHYILPVFPAFAIITSYFLYKILKHLRIKGIILISLLATVLFVATLANAQTHPIIDFSAETHADITEETWTTSLALLKTNNGFPKVVTAGVVKNNNTEYGEISLFDFDRNLFDKIAGNYLEANSTINAIALGDVNSDNKDEIVSIGTIKNGNSFNAQMSIWDSTELELKKKIDWSWGVETIGTAIAIGDLRNAGQMQIVTAGTFYNGTCNVALLCVWHGKDLIVEKSTSWATSGNTTINSIALGDLNNDDLLEIVVGGYYLCDGKEISQITVWNSELDFIMDTGVQSGINSLWNVNVRINSIAVGDVDEDHVPEIVSGGICYQDYSSIAQLIVWNSKDFSVEKSTNWNNNNSSSISSLVLTLNKSGKGLNIVTAGGFSIDSVNYAQIIITDGLSLSLISSTSWSWYNGTQLNALATLKDPDSLVTHIFSAGSFIEEKKVAQLVASNIQE